MTWFLIMLFCAAGNCEDVGIEGFESQDQCQAALTRAIDKHRVLKTEGIDHFYCERGGDHRA